MTSLDEKTKEKIQQTISDHSILLFMKGDKQQPQCGFSAQVVQILNSYEVDYHTVNVLEDWDIREGIKEFSQWPTIPQLYVEGKFLGGCDITMELHRKGELKKALVKE